MRYLPVLCPCIFAPHGNLNIFFLNFLKFKQRGYPPTEEERVSTSDEDAVRDVMEQHDQFISSMMSRLAKLQVIFRKKR